MLSVHGRKPAAVFVEPVAKLAIAAGLTPNMVTVIGAIVTTAIAVVLIPAGFLFWAAVLSGGAPQRRREQIWRYARCHVRPYYGWCVVRGDYVVADLRL